MLLAVSICSCSCSQMTTGSLTIGLRLVGAFEAGFQGVGYMLLFAASLLVGFTCWRSDDNRLADEHLGKLSGDDGDVVRGRRVIRGRWRCSFPEQEKLHIFKVNF